MTSNIKYVVQQQPSTGCGRSKQILLVSGGCEARIKSSRRRRLFLAFYPYRTNKKGEWPRPPALLAFGGLGKIEG
jgi:hypothetical protein